MLYRQSEQFHPAFAQNLSETEQVNGALHHALLFAHLANSEFLKNVSVHVRFFYPSLLCELNGTLTTKYGNAMYVAEEERKESQLILTLIFKITNYT